LTWITNDELEKFKLNSSRCTSRDVASLRRKDFELGQRQDRQQRARKPGKKSRESTAQRLL